VEYSGFILYPKIEIMRPILKDCVYFGIDFVQIYLLKEHIDFFDSLVFEIDEDNSQSAYILLDSHNFQYSKIHPKGYKLGLKFSLNVTGKIIDAFALNFEKYKLTETGSVDFGKITLTLYSQVFSISHLWHFDLYGFLLSHFRIWPHNKLKRIDFCADFTRPKKDIIPYFNYYEIQTLQGIQKVQFHSKVGRTKSGDYETYYTRQVQSDKNRYMVTRIYDKKKDTFKKQKWFLYTHLWTEDVNRVEVEIRKEYAWTIAHSFTEILSTPQLQFNLFIKFLNKDLAPIHQLIPQDVKAIKSIVLNGPWKDDYLKNLHREGNLADNFQRLGFIPKEYLRIANGYAKTILNITGYKWFFQYILWNYFEAPQVHEFPSWKKWISYKWRSPEVMLEEYVNYLKNSLHLEPSRINRMLKNNIQPVKLKK